jgi:hypothetical protein
MSHIDPFVSSVNKTLYRPLKDGAAYEGLIPKHIKLVSDLDKESDRINTYETLKYMGEWSTKYAYQMQKVAPLLKGRNIQETVNKIYAFLYSHFQYKLDGPLFQDILAPSAAWYYRRTGFDCKTFSVLASTILQNLRIPHSFRMVQQAGIMPGEWSHVYVIVPNGNTHFTIDATTHDNKEVLKTKKHDYTMIHRGLASPYVSALGCACQGTPIKSSGLGSPANLANTIRNFHSFLDVLEKQGISKDVTNRMLTIVRANVENGIDPNMGEVLKKALATTSGLGFIDPVSSITASGYSLPTMNVSVPTGNYYTPTTQLQSGFQTAVSAGTSALSNVSIGGVSGGAVMSAIAGDPSALIGSALTILKKIIPIEKTFGAVFANGFDLSCWGASYSEQKAKEHVLLDMPFIVEWSGIYQSATTANLDKFQLFTESYLLDAKNGQQSKYAKCTRKGHALREKAIVELRKNIYLEFTSQGFQLVPNGRKTGTFSIPQGLPGYAKGRAYTSWNGPTSYDSLLVVPPTPVAPTPTPEAGTKTDSSGKPITASKSSSTPLILGAGLLALKLLL